MAFIKNNGEQDWIKTTKIHESCSGYFEVGTLVKITGKTERGYNIEDEFGNKINEIGWII